MFESDLRGLYAITDSGPRTPDEWVSVCESVLRGGAQVLQYRDKSDDAAHREANATALVVLCRRYRALLIINDDVELALRAGAHGVHLGREDTDIAIARQRLGKDRLIGVSCYNELSRAEAASAAGADYVAFGSFYASPTKPGAVRADPELLEKARRKLGLPLVAIGGITPENGASLICAGADMLAVISGVFQQPDPTAAAKRYARLFKNQ